MSETKATAAANELRAKMIGDMRLEAARELVPCELSDGSTIYLRQPSIEDHDEILKAAGYDPANMVEMLPGRIQIWALARLAVDASGARVFADRDVAELRRQPRGGIVSQLGEKAAALVNQRQEDEKKD